MRSPSTWTEKLNIQPKRVLVRSSFFPDPFSQPSELRISFAGSRAWSASVPPDPALPGIVEYLLDSPTRIFHASFGDMERMDELGEGKFRVRMLPLQFFHLSVTPVVILHVRSERIDGSAKLHLTCHEIALHGIPPEDSERFHLHLAGELVGTPGGHIRGSVLTRIETSVPNSLMFTPTSVLEIAGNALVTQILTVLNNAVERSLVNDYYVWCRRKNMEK